MLVGRTFAKEPVPNLRVYLLEGVTRMSRPQATEVPVLGTYPKCVLTIIAVLLAVIAIRPFASPPITAAASDSQSLYVEPGTTALRSPDGMQQVQGKVIIDLRNGDVWGFPTPPSVPYPVDVTRNDPPTSTPMYLGKFDFSKLAK